MSKPLPRRQRSQVLDILFFFSIFLVACASLTPEKFTSEKPLYDYALKLFNDREYTDSITFFESLRNRFPQSPYVIDAELKIADAHYAKDSYAEAEVAYQNFRTLHPTHPKIPYVVFRMGMTHFERIPKGVDRDQTHTERTISIFDEVVNRWPASKEATEAQKHLAQCYRNLAERELYVANFYLKRREYKAAIGRLETVRNNPNFKEFRAEASYKLGLAYSKLKDPVKAKEILSEVAQDANAKDYQAKAKNLLKQVN